MIKIFSYHSTEDILRRGLQDIKVYNYLTACIQKVFIQAPMISSLFIGVEHTSIHKIRERFLF